jgi:maltose O-acetyltransferase
MAVREGLEGLRGKETGAAFSLQNSQPPKVELADVTIQARLGTMVAYSGWDLIQSSEGPVAASGSGGGGAEGGGRRARQPARPLAGPGRVPRRRRQPGCEDRRVSEWEKMVAGEVYDPLDSELVAARRRARAVCDRFNAEPDEQARMAMLAELFAGFGEESFVERPFFCDYGTNISFGRGCFLNFNVVILDPAPVRLGERVLVGPAAQLLTADHPRERQPRAAGIETAAPVVIGDDVWIGAGAIVCPGVTIGEGSVVGAGAVVAADLPAGVVAAGNPCRVLRELGAT